MEPFKAMLVDAGLTQAEFAAALPVSKKTLLGWEIGNPLRMNLSSWLNSPQLALQSGNAS
jgi:DNA-binding transcriptional regulator YiaG